MGPLADRHPGRRIGPVRRWRPPQDARGRARRYIAAMKVLVALQKFAHVGGTETYVLTVAEQLQRLGHQVAHLRRAASATWPCSPAIAASTWSATARRARASRDDVVLAQDAATAYELADRWPERAAGLRQPQHACSTSSSRRWCRVSSTRSW